MLEKTKKVLETIANNKLFEQHDIRFVENSLFENHYVYEKYGILE